jgi:hypothetical protein
VLIWSDVDHSNPNTKLKESDSPECLRLSVNELVLSVDEINTNPSIIQALPNEVVSQIDVFATLMEH